MQKKSFLRQCAVNLALAFIILSIYFITTDPSAQSIIARISTSPTFRGDVPLPGVGLMCQFEGEADELLSFGSACKEGGLTITFFVSAGFAERNQEALYTVGNQGHSVELYGNGNLSYEEMEAYLEQGKHNVAQATGREPVLFLPLRGEYSRSAMAAAQRMGMVPVLWSMDVRDSEAIHEEYAQEIAERSQSGELILIPQDLRFEASAEQIAQYLKARQLETLPASSLIRIAN